MNYHLTDRNFIYDQKINHTISRKNSVSKNDLSIEYKQIENFNFSISNNDNFSFSIVVVDDNKLIRESTVNLVKKVFSTLNIVNFKVIEGSDGIDLLNIVRADKDNKIKYIFTDENMEYLNGSEAVKLIRKFEESKKIHRYNIISITAFDDEGTRSNILKSGINSILSKPCCKSDINKYLQNLK